MLRAVRLTDRLNRKFELLIEHVTPGGRPHHRFPGRPPGDAARNPAGRRPEPQAQAQRMPRDPRPARDGPGSLPSFRSRTASGQAPRFVTGKGGTGKTTVAAALGLAAARAGKRVLVAEVAEQERIGGLGKDEVGYEETELAPGCSLLGGPRPGARGVGALSAALAHARRRAEQQPPLRLPGCRGAGPGGAGHDRQGLGARQARAQGQGRGAYDLVVVDSPATGHGLAMRGRRARSATSPESARSTGRRSASTTSSRLPADRDPGGGAAGGDAGGRDAGPGETAHDDMGMALDAIVVNGLYPERFTRDEARAPWPRWTAPSRRCAPRCSSTSAPALRAASCGGCGRAPGAGDHAGVLFEPELGLEQLEELSRGLERRLP